MGQKDLQFFTFTKEKLFSHFKVSENGLSQSEVASRLKLYGQNRLTAKKPLSPFAVYLSQFKNNLILILLGSALLIFFVWYFGERDQADLVEATLILAIVVMITFFGFIQEYKAEKAIEALKKLLAYKAKVRREGKDLEVDVTTLVPGDLVILEEGLKVPADIRLIETATLFSNEASLTGESAPIAKTTSALSGTLAVADQKNMVFAGTVITQGRGLGIVVQTGDNTEIGKIAHDVAEVEDDPTPIQKRLDAIGRILGYAVLAIAVLVFLFVVFFASEYFHLSLLQRILHSFIAAVALAVAAIPEGLPAVVTIALALGTQRMLARKALVRRLNSAETLGSTDIIAADKTGTLTKGEMTVRFISANGQDYEVTGTGYEQTGEFRTGKKKVSDLSELETILKAGLFCNNAEIVDEKEILGDPTEIALLISAAKARLKNSAKRLDEMPFSSERKMMSVTVQEESKTYVYAKGAPEVILSKCKKIAKNGKITTLTSSEREAILAKVGTLSASALRTLGFAYKEIDKKQKDPEIDLIFIGLQAMIDPPRDEVKPLIKQCEQSGIHVIMITGDHPETAKAVAHEIGIKGEVMTGQQLDDLSETDLARTIGDIQIFARVNPSSKMKIVSALKAQGHIVAMTGDGVNDAPALKKADIGIAMGITGTDVAKEASDMVLLDDHFQTIIASVEEGRGIFDNIRKFVNYLLSCNIGEVFIVLVAVLVYQDLPLTATMLLWINVVTDGLPAIALGMDRPEPDVMHHPPEKYQGQIVDKRLWGEMIIFGIIITVLTLWLYQAALPLGEAQARGIAFTGVVVFELVRLFIIRLDYHTSPLSNGWLLAAVGLSFLLQLIILYVPAVAKLFQLQPIDLTHWIQILVCSFILWFSFWAARLVLNRLLPDQVPPQGVKTA